MNAAGAVDIDRHVERYRQTGYERYDENAPAYSYDEAAAEREKFRASSEGGSVPVIEEELQVGKRAVRRGGVRVYSHVVDQPVEESVELREERVTVNRRAVDRPVERGELSGLRDQSIEVQEVTEEPVVQKRARVREEVVVGKETKTRTEKVRDTVRRTRWRSSGWGARSRGTTPTTGRTSGGIGRHATGPREARMRPTSRRTSTGIRAQATSAGAGRNWSEVESDLRTDWERRNPGNAWDRLKDSVRYGWEKVTGRR